MKIVFPEINHPNILAALQKCSEVEPIPAKDLEDACLKVKTGAADALIAGIDYSSREVILACFDIFGKTSDTFSSSVVLSKQGTIHYILADIATCKNPTAEQLCDIIFQTYQTAKSVLAELPKVALLSFSTSGSGGTDASMTKIRHALKLVRERHPQIVIDGEMQLDAAIVPEIAKKKMPNSPVAGRANVLICPDINSGNILYKAMEHFGGFEAAGPILQGFNFPASDLSRGSSVDDIVRTIEVLTKINARH